MNKWLYTVGMVILVLPLYSQVRFSGLDEMLGYADKNSTVARQSAVQREINTEDLGIVRAGLLPRFTAFGAAEYAPIIASQVIPESIFGGQDGKFRKVQFGMPWNFSAGIEMNMPIINFEKWSELEKTKLRSIENSWSEKAKLENLHIQITKWYYHVLAAKEMIRLNQENIQVVNELMRILEERKRNGVLDPADYNRSKNLQLNIETAQLDYQKLQEQGLIMLGSLLNIPATVPFQIADSITLFTWPLYEGNIIKIGHRPALKESLAKTEVARQAVIQSRKASLPKLSLSSRYLYNWQMNNTQKVHFDVNTIGLRMDYTLFNGGYHRRQQRKSDLLLKSSYINQQQTESSLIQQQQGWANSYNSAFTKRRTLERKVDAASDNLRIARLNLKEGVMEFDTFNNIFSDYIRAQIEKVQNLSEGILYHLLLINNNK